METKYIVLYAQVAAELKGTALAVPLSLKIKD